MATISSNELKSQLDTYRQQAGVQNLRVLSAALSGRVHNGSMTEAEKAALIQQYTETLAKLDEQQSALLSEYEKTGRVRLTSMSNMISNYAKIVAAAKAAQGTTGAATISAEAQRLGQLDTAMSREGPGLQADLGEAFKESAAGLRGFMQDGKVSDPSQFGGTLVNDLEKLAATNPKMVMPYIREVEGSTGVKIDQFLSGQSLGPGAGGIPSDMLGRISSFLRTGAQADLEAQRRGRDISTEQMKSSAQLLRSVGSPTALQFANDVDKIASTLGLEIGDEGTQISELPPPSAQATPEQRANWVAKVSGGRLSLGDDGHVYESGGEHRDMMPYEEFAAYHAPGGGFKVEDQFKPYLKETRDRIVREMDRLTNSTDRSDLQTKAHIMESPEFAQYAAQRGYSITDPASANQTFKKLMQERKLQIMRTKSDQNMIEDINTITGMKDSTALGVAAANVRQGLRSIFKPNQARPSAVVTNGAQTPAEVAPTISESSKDTTEAKSNIEEPKEYTGPGGWKYRVNGTNVSVIGRDPKFGKTGITADKPKDLSPLDAAKAMKELGIEAPAMPSPEVLKQEAPRLAELADQDEQNLSPEQGDFEFGNAEDKIEVDSEVPKEEPAAPAQPPAKAPPMTEDQRRQARLATLNQARSEAMQRVGAEKPAEAAPQEGENAPKPAAVLKSMLGSFGGGYEQKAPTPLEIPGLKAPTPTPGPAQPTDMGPETPEDRLAPISRRRRFELLRGLAQ